MKFEKTYCSQCGGEFGAGDSGYSSCADHAPTRSLDQQIDWAERRLAWAETDAYGEGESDYRAILASLKRLRERDLNDKITVLFPYDTARIANDR